MSLKTLDSTPLITLVGPPNSGKTTLFNYLSGKNFKTANYPGATVEYSISKMLGRFGINANLIDSPGIVSLIPGSPDEQVSVDSLFNNPHYGESDLVIVTVDASQLSRHLFLVKQLSDAGFKIIIALTMCDLLNRKGLDISTARLSLYFNCEVIKIDGRNGKGVQDIIFAIDKYLKSLDKNGQHNNYAKLLEVNGSELIQMYRDIEEIESEALFEIPSNGNTIDLINANKNLNIINSTIKKSIRSVDEKSIKIDRFLLHPIWGLISFFLIMSAMFTSIFWLAEPLMRLVDELFGFLSMEATGLLGSAWISDLISNGIITGTGSVLVFVPQIFILFLILGLLEDTGYLARGAMLIDKPLSKIGLNGKSFVPMLSGFACAIPAMMAARTIPNKRERFLTIFILPLMSCSARLPVYALLIAFLLPADKAWIGGIALAGIYMLSILSSILFASVINRFKSKIIRESDRSSFILELPAYRLPKLRVILSNTYMSSKLYLKKAGPIILTFSIILWMLTYFPNNNPKVETKNLSQQEIVQIKNSERLATSYAADMGKTIQPLMRPLGLDWRVGVALIAAFTAREVFVSSMALIFKVTNDQQSLQNSMIDAMRKAEIEGTNIKLFTPATITGLIVFFIFALQCLSTVAVSRKETGSWRIPLLQIIIFTGTAYFLTFITVNGLRALGLN